MPRPIMFAPAFALALLLGSLVAFGVALLDGAGPLSAAFIALVAVGPPVMACALVAGAVAAFGIRAEPTWSRARWLTQGAGWGVVSGGLSWPVWLTVMNGRDAWRQFDALGLMLLFGGGVGAAIGVAVASYCLAARRRALAV